MDKLWTRVTPWTRVIPLNGRLYKILINELKVLGGGVHDLNLPDGSARKEVP